MEENQNFNDQNAKFNSFGKHTHSHTHTPANQPTN